MSNNLHKYNYFVMLLDQTPRKAGYARATVLSLFFFRTNVYHVPGLNNSFLAAIGFSFKQTKFSASML
jgi:hypothetical protein